MKHLYTILASVLCFAPLLSAQITISQNQFQPLFTPGDSMSILSSSDASVDIGHTGGPNIYDFSSLHYSSGKAAIAIGSSIPLIATRFPNDTILVLGNQYTALNFGDGEYTVSGEVDVLSDTSYSVAVRQPREIQLGFPISYNSTWNYQTTFYDTTYVNGKVTYAQSFQAPPSTIVVDGYGTLVLPGGDSVQCLREVNSTPEEPGPGESHYWNFITQTGVYVLISSNGAQPDTGIVGIDRVSIFEGTLPTPVRKQQSILASFALNQNYPNPFNPTTVISYQLPISGVVLLRVYDVLGRELVTLVNEHQSAGHHSVTFNAANLPSGAYLYRLEAGTYHDTKRLLLLK